MSKPEETTQRGPESEDQSFGQRVKDDRRGEVKPSDNPVPSSPEPEQEAVREGEEKLERL